MSKKDFFEEYEELLQEEMEDEQDVEEIDFSTIPVVPMDLDNVMFEQYDTELFKEGIKDMSRVAGQITALKNLGLTEDGVVSLVALLCERDALPLTLEHSLKLANIQTVNLEKATI